MAPRSKHEYLRGMWQRYQQANRAARVGRLDEVTRVCRYHRTDAIAVLPRRPPPHPPLRRVVRRRPTYSERVIRLLAEIGAASGYLCGIRLKAALPHWLPWLKRRVEIPPAVEAQLRRISGRQIDRRLATRRPHVTRTLYGTTRPGALLNHLIPLKLEQWEVRQPGDLESDLVSHSGASGAGEFLQTVDGVDVQTTWVERQAIGGQGRHAVVQAMRAIEARLPCALRGVDSENGSEFINDHLLAWCQERPPGQRRQFTRSRPYQKDDTAHFEQKNGTPVRKLVGWERYETAEALAALNALDAELRLFQNLFQPSMTLGRNVRVGSRRLTHYEAPQTPLDRVRACPEADPQEVAALEQLRQRTDPVELSKRIDRPLEQVWAVASRATRTPRETAPRPPQPRGTTPWRGWTFSKRAISARSEGRPNIDAHQ